MVVIAFPAIRPTERQYTPGKYPVRRPDFYSIAENPRLMGNKSFDAKLSLSFENIDDADAALFVQKYKDSFGGFFPLSLPAETVAGISDTALATRIRTGQHLVWRFSGPPDVTSIITGVSSVKVELIASLVLDNNDTIP